MPPTRAKSSEGRRFVPFFPPPTLLCDFGPELRLPRTQLNYLKTFKPDGPDSGVISQSPDVLIRKPPGSVARPGRDGYSLRAFLNWDRATYNAVQVRIQSKWHKAGD